MASKKTNYVPAAIDADGDGMVQDGTEFERPVGTELAGELEEDTPVVVIATSKPDVHVVAEGENWQTIAAIYAPSNVRRQDYAKKLFDANGVKDLRAGMVITIV